MADNGTNRSTTGKSPIHRRHRDLPADPGQTPAKRVGLKPAGGWHRRNFLADILIPALFTRRQGSHQAPLFPTLGNDEVCITWIGHASFLLQFPHCNILVDPNWSNWLKGIKRLKLPGMHLGDLPQIDLVLVTHAHFDHLDKRTLRAIAADQPIVVPFEVGNLVHKLGFQRVHELHYWETLRFNEVNVTLTPCHHWGARVLHDQHRGFGGFVVADQAKSIFHAGDTAYFNGFRDIGQRHPIDIALLPIGAYDTPSGREVHMNPEEALTAFDELGARWMVPMHFGTFPLSFEPLHEPLARLHSQTAERNLHDRIRVLEEGCPKVF